ncbi:MAG: histidinol phosphatase [Oscillospiraceae bacterium]|nr:histidinol phosphatase [Oscillospiraceae bacterium]
MFLYETHLHTYPVSRCAHAGVREVAEFYKNAGFAGIFITNHFLDGNINIDSNLPYEERIHFYFSDYEQAVQVGREIGLDVFCGVEMSHYGTDFLIYGLDKQWFLAHPEIMGMEKSEQLRLMDEYGALIIQAHPFRAAFYIDHIRLFPSRVHGAEIYNGANTEFENKLAKQYAENFDLIPFAGTDNHFDKKRQWFGGMQTDTPIADEADFVDRVKNGRAVPFCREIGDAT